MKALQITQEMRQEMTHNGIVICSGNDTLGQQVEYISIEHAVNYPMLSEIEIVTDAELSYRITELEAINAELIKILNDKQIIP